MVPEYLHSVCRTSIENNLDGSHRYNLRNRNDLRLFLCKTSTYIRSYFPTSIRDWNNLPLSVRSAVSLHNFKDKLKLKPRGSNKKLFSCGSRYARVNHTRLRLGLSGLNQHRYNYKFIDNPACPNCSYPSEDIGHFFFDCNRYCLEREELFSAFAAKIAPGVHYSLIMSSDENDRFYLLHGLLNGLPDLSFEDNIEVFRNVHAFISKTKGF